MSSATFDSWETIIAWAKRYYDPNLPLYYSEQHMRILLDMIGAALSRRQFRYVCTHLPLLEPIMTDGRGAVVFVSRYLVALYVNQPVRSPIDRVALVRNFDLIGELAPVLKTIEKSKRSTCCNELFSTKVDETDEFDDELIKLPLCDQTSKFAQHFSDAENVRFHHLVRLTLLVAHWVQHRRNAIPYNDHSHFRDLVRERVSENDNDVVPTNDDSYDSDTSDEDKRRGDKRDNRRDESDDDIANY